MSVTLAKGFRAAGVAAGIKGDGVLDVALVVADAACPTAAVFTVSDAAAAPVRLSREHLATGSPMRAIVLNSGGANAATGPPGVETARLAAREVAAIVGCAASEVIVCSTGIIGEQLPRREILGGISAAAAKLGATEDAAADAARAIMTTDRVPKQAAFMAPDGWAVGAMAKGAGMIRPDMATLLAVITTDAVVEHDEVAAALSDAVDRSFHELNIDGCPSTNDTVALFASGASHIRPEAGKLAAAVAAVCRDLAEQLAADAEGASRVVTLHVAGTDTDAEARRLGRAVADSALVRSAFYGGDPNWGRIVGALGAAGAADVGRADIDFAGTAVARGGTAVEFDEAALAGVMTSGDFTVWIGLGQGSGTANVLTTDLTPEYVRFNGERS